MRHNGTFCSSKITASTYIKVNYSVHMISSNKFGGEFMLKQFLLLAIAGLLVIAGLIFISLAWPWWWFFLGVIVVAFALLVILFTMLLRFTCYPSRCIFYTFVIISLGILLTFTGVAMAVFQPWMLWLGIIIVFLSILVIALGILLAAEC